MTEKEFLNKYHLKDSTTAIAVLDDIYLRFTRDQALELMLDFYTNADEIYNSKEEKVIDKA